MNIYNIKVYFASGRISYKIGTLIKGDYNSSKLVFEFDDDSGVKMFELLKPDGTTKWIKEIINNEIILTDTDELNKTIPLLSQEGTYIFEIAKYDNNSKLTSVKGKFKVIDVSMSTFSKVDKDNPIYMYNRVITVDGISFGTGIHCNLSYKNKEFRKFLNEHDYKNSTDFFRCLTLYEISKKEKNKRVRYNTQF